MKQGFVYILSNDCGSVLYIGVTADLRRRMYEHRHHLIKGFTDTYNVTRLIYYETTNLLTDAIAREKQLKGWTRAKKLALVQTMNPDFNDLYDLIMQD